MIDSNFVNNNINQLFGGSPLSQAEAKKSDQFHTISSLLPYRSFDERTRLFINQDSVGFALEANPLVGADDSVVSGISKMLSDGVPPGCTIQFINWASPKIGDIFDIWQKPRQTKGGIYRKLAEERIKFFRDANCKSLFDSNPFTLKNFRLIIAVSLPIEVKDQDLMQKLVSRSESESNLKNATDKLLSFRKKFVTALSTASIHATEMDAEQFLNFVDEILNFDTSPYRDRVAYNPLEPINKQLTNTESSLKVTRNKLDFADKVSVRCLSIKSFPDNWRQWQNRDLIGDFFNDLRRAEHPFLTAFSMTFPHNEDKVRGTAVRKHQLLERRSKQPIAKVDKSIERGAKEWGYVNQKIKEGEKIVKTTYRIAVFGTKDTIDEAEQSIKSIYGGCGWTVTRDDFVQLISFKTALPFILSEGLFEDLEKMGRTNTMVSWTGANLAPLQAEWRGMVGSPCMMLFGRRGQIFFWDPFANTDGNFNCIVVGRSGSGKSVFMQDLVTSLRGSDCIVYVIDDGRSFMNSCTLQGGATVEFSDKAKVPICINPFSVVDEKKMAESQEYSTEVIKLITAIVTQMCEGDPTKKNKEILTGVQVRMIEEAVGEIWNKHSRKGSISHVRDFFAAHPDQRIKDLATLVRPFTKDGVYGRFFEGESNLSLSNHFMVFETSELKNKKELQSIVVMFIMFLISENMYFGDRKQKITLVIDEAWDLLHGEGSSVFIEGMARRARKYGGNLVLGTQSVNDFFKNTATIAAFENSDWVVMLSQKKESIEMLKQTKKVVMDESLEEILKDLKRLGELYSEAVIYGPRGWAVGRMILDKFSVSLYSSAADDWSKINSYVASGCNLEEAVASLAEEKKPKAKRSFFTPSDYRKIFEIAKKDRRTYEDALEKVVVEKIQSKFPQVYKEFHDG